MKKNVDHGPERGRPDSMAGKIKPDKQEEMRNEKTTIINEVGARARSATRWWTMLGILCLILAATAVASSAQTPEETPSYSVLYTFTGGADGANPYNAGVIRDQAGNLYGTTGYGGATGPYCIFGGCGVVFKLDPNGVESVIHTFSSVPDGANPGGATPAAGLIRDPLGNLYGTTLYGGTHGEGFGVVFKLDPSGQHFTVLYTFTGGTDGWNSSAGLVRDPAGNLYGTAEFGGADNDGVVFKVDPAGTETVLYSFTGGADGSFPLAGLIRDQAGNLYGTAAAGGNTSASCASGCGVVFKLDPSGQHYKVLYAFTGGTDGGSPEAGLTQDSAGNLYGTTVFGGNTSTSCPNGSSGCGVVYKLDRAGTETVLYTFSGGVDGAFPGGVLVMDRAGNLYGTTGNGGNSSSSCPFGSYGCGVVFRLDPTGTETVLYTFTGGADGNSPRAGLVRDAAGNLYGTTIDGGNTSSSCPNGVYGCGVVFKITFGGNVDRATTQ